MFRVAAVSVQFDSGQHANREVKTQCRSDAEARYIEDDEFMSRFKMYDAHYVGITQR